MKICTQCHQTFADSEGFCPNCGLPLEIAQPQAAPEGAPNYNYAPAGAPVYADPSDHTAEFSAEDISKNKVVAMLPYLSGFIGIIVASLIGANNSPYASFHIREALKINVIQTLTGIVTALTFWLILPAIAGGIFMLVLMVVNIICFFNVCSGKAKEAPIIDKFKFLK